ncbi:putative major facilitator superfamily transporter [Gordonia polyisoprenivorans NBRC 16320 = JCM 10675]|uniref:MFS transporter n=1 Tax=Gordonia polyisoprenivorans TaxID=84595 RepID=A0A846WRB5_9ACTN|nr:MFS transporter [Gordonia polyisoprenivorans]NKY02861.1 MFS transporter [Gordonia polyisoprenivorans]WCB37205.1 MFS transporter [Gordonia polyisoprenivorans]GAB24946.1 putative major facilitator superfamily transporter [Gordonia polyisoprenivorans NBRC 16320 = JCM 10675]
MSFTRTHGAAVDRAVAKFYRRVVPLFIVMLICNQLNRANIGYAAEYLHTDVGIGAAAYGFGAGVFFIAYAIFELPSNMMMEKFGARIWLTRIMISWGVISAAMMFVQNEMMFYILRFLLGAAEAGFFPAVIFYLAKWLPNSSRGRATALFVAGSSLAAAISGPVSGPLLSMHGLLGLHGWQWLFLIEGSLSVVVGIIAYFLLNSHISDAKWLSTEERDALSSTIAEEERRKAAGSGVAHKTSRWSMLADRQLIIFCVIYFAIQLSIYANTFWLPSIVRRIQGTNDVTVGLLSSLPWICAVVAMYVSSRIGDRTGNRRPLLVIALLVAAVGTYAAAVVSPWPALVFLCIAAMGFKSASPLFWSIPQSTLHPMVLAPAIAIINSLGNLGGFVAPFGFGLVKQATGQVTWGLYGLAIASVIAAILVFFLRRPTPESEASVNTDVLTDTPAVTPTAANAVATRAAENKTAHGVDR